VAGGAVAVRPGCVVADFFVVFDSCLFKGPYKSRTGKWRHSAAPFDLKSILAENVVAPLAKTPDGAGGAISYLELSCPNATVGRRNFTISNSLFDQNVVLCGSPFAICACFLLSDRSC
jgi:hypothetical protein